MPGQISIQGFSFGIDSVGFTNFDPEVIRRNIHAFDEIETVRVEALDAGIQLQTFTAVFAGLFD